jgi:hypothetical protein
MDEHDPRELEEAFRHLWRVGPVGEDWAAQAAVPAALADHALLGPPVTPGVSAPARPGDASRRTPAALPWRPRWR